MFSTPSRAGSGGVNRASRPRGSSARPSRGTTPLASTSNLDDATHTPSKLAPAASLFAADITPNHLLTPSSATAASRRRGAAAAAAAASTSYTGTHNGARFLPGSSGLGRQGTPRSSVARSFRDDASVADTVDSQQQLFGHAASAEEAHLEEGATLMRDDLMAVTAFSRLPTEVLEQLESVDFYLDAFKGAMDTATGYAYMVSRTQCFVWNYQSHGTSSPTCFTFDIPESSSSSMHSTDDLAQCGLIPRSAAREPGIVLVTPSGQVRFWEGISASMAREDLAQTIQVSLNPQETVMEMQRLDDFAFVLATSQARMLKLGIVSQGGRLQAELAPFSQPRGILGRLFGSGSSMGFGNEGITAIAVGPVQENEAARDVYAIGSRTVQKWRMVDGAGERLIAEHDVRQVVASGVLQGSDERYSAAEGLAFDLVDGVVQADGKLVVLYSQNRGASTPLSYGLATLDLLKDGSSFVVNTILPLRYTAFNDPRPYATPRLSLSYGGPAAFVTFADTVILKSLQAGCEGFEEVVKLKDTARNRFIGTGSDPADVGGSAPIATLSLITASSGSLLIELGLEQVASMCNKQASAEERQRAKTERLKVKVEQALYYAESPLNPLSFELPADFQGTLITACEELSSEILESRNSAVIHTPFPVDLRLSLKDRLDKLRSLIVYVFNSGHLGKLSQTSRRRLRSDAELAAAAYDLWLYQNDYISLANIRGSRTSSPLSDCVEQVMTESGQGMVDDLVRTFFRHHIQQVGQVFEQLLKRAKAAASQSLAVRSSETVEANRIALAAFQAAARYRKERGEVYGITDSLAAFEPWTAKPGSIELLETLFNATSSLLPDRTRELGTAVDTPVNEYLSSTDAAAERGQVYEQRLQSELKGQLCLLAEHALGAYEERLRYLRASASDAAFERELNVVEATFRRVRPLFVHPLFDLGRTERAMALAERHGDFRTLTELCNDASLGRSEARIEHYLEKYREAFAFELYGWMVERGQTRRLLTQKAQYAELVLGFFERGGNERIEWLHHLALRQFGAASTTLRDAVAPAERDVGQKKAMLSLAKLAYVAELNVEQIATVREQRRIEDIDDQLDLLAVHERLRGMFQEALQEALMEEGDGSADVAVIVAGRLNDMRAYALEDHYARLVKRALANEVLSSEDLIDLLTLKDCRGQEANDYSTAIEVYIRATDAPKPRMDAALCSIWRRVILRDDWAALSNTTNVSDEELLSNLRSTALYSTLASVFSHESAFETFKSPTDLVSPPEREMVAARFAGSLPDQTVDLLVNDLQAEIDLVQRLLDDTDLPRLFAEVARMAQKGGAAEVPAAQQQQQQQDQERHEMEAEAVEEDDDEEEEEDVEEEDMDAEGEDEERLSMEE
ncbi:uncharacterized protein PFL1_01952 [Pseudozyma flocculosa PF-1]|uniref:Nucleoporin Nup133/Nup155-like C-terminal domain-containing protein n=1 Tax=Pseudozyma flocculosa TaxID=84751 RepID=A0A5C3EYZ6_9BASI|nr:uncharacterized protein PFL1_01952 [Pseudozyma flocculosa PF-1]EPQ30426.1 hypothetical protein PFL1_01952 [Pseudozyma flocculosa PF-1]SPO37503.1 uncharacterized protein PSFLO_02978 [Pseudozyma flocculosa]